MLFISMEDFWVQASAIKPLTREEENVLARRMAAGERGAREALIQSGLPLVASHIRRSPREIRSLHTVYACIAEVEKGVDRFNFLQDGETFAHHMGWRLRQCITRCIAERF